MTGTDDYLKMAIGIKQQMDNERKMWTTKTRLELITLLRAVSKQPRLRIGRNVADSIEAALEQQGFRAFPHINEVGQHEAVRIIRRGTTLDKILNAFLHPGDMTDEQLAELANKLKQNVHRT